MKKTSTLWLIALIGVGVGYALSSCDFHPPSKPWQEVIGRNLLIEELDCYPGIPTPTDEHCHIVVTPGANGVPQPTRYLQVSKPFGRHYSITIVTPGADKSGDAEVGMTCPDMLEFGQGYELNGNCLMDHGSSSKVGPHEHTFRAWMHAFPGRGATKWRVDFEFIHNKVNPKHNGSGHTETQ